MIGLLLPLQAFLVAVALVPGISGAAVAPRWAVAALSLYFLTPLWPLLFALAALLLLDFDTGMKWCVVAGAFACGTGLDDRNARQVAVAFAAGVAVSGAVAVAQRLGFDGVPQEVAPAGFFVNKNFMGEAAALVAVFGLRWSWWPLIVTGPALLLSGCRSAWVAAALAAGATLRLRWYSWLAGTAAFCLAAAFTSPDSLMQRLELWRDAAPVVLAGLPWGAGSPLEPLHNEFIQVLSELGVAAVAVYAVAYRVASRDLALAVCLAVLCSFGFPLHLPATAWLAAISCGYCVGGLPHDERARVRSARRAGSTALVPPLRA